MANEQKSKSGVNQSMFYQIMIKGHLGQQRMNWFEGLIGRHDPDKLTDAIVSPQNNLAEFFCALLVTWMLQ